jgi:5-methylcytosine-specific restriction enzyme subunit McrC
MAMTLTIDLTESTPRAEALADLTDAAGVDRERLTTALTGLVDVEATWDRQRVLIRPGPMVGTIVIGRLRVNVRPRLAAAEMATLIRYALGGTAGWQRSQVATAKVGLDELVCGVLADELTRVRNVGLSRQYVNRREPLPVLRGRPDFVGSFPWNDRGQTVVTCRYHELTCDVLDNQLVRAALERATLMDVTVATRRRLLEHRQAWAELASLRPVGREEFAAARARYTRLTEHYRLAHNLAELIVLGQRPAELYADATTPTGGLSLNMAWLFERFVARLVNDRLRPRGLVVRAQESDAGALVDRDGYRYRTVRPDLVVYRRDVPIAVIDAKYKELWQATDDGTPVRRIGNDDLYQLFFYAQRLQLRHGLASPPPAVIVCPLPEDDEREADVIGDRFTRITWRAGSEVACSIELLMLPLTLTLRQMAKEGRHETTLGGIDAL